MGLLEEAARSVLGYALPSFATAIWALAFVKGDCTWPMRYPWFNCKLTIIVTDISKIL